MYVLCLLLNNSIQSRPTWDLTVVTSGVNVTCGSTDISQKDVAALFNEMPQGKHNALYYYSCFYTVSFLKM